ncbi:hypothetical protein vseg_018807 [Gypsophila vaccaria]
MAMAYYFLFNSRANTLLNHSLEHTLDTIALKLSRTNVVATENKTKTSMSSLSQPRGVDANKGKRLCRFPPVRGRIKRQIFDDFCKLVKQVIKILKIAIHQQANV